MKRVEVELEVVVLEKVERIVWKLLSF